MAEDDDPLKLSEYFPCRFWALELSARRAGMDDAECWLYLKTIAMIHAEGGYIESEPELKAMLKVSAFRYNRFRPKLFSLLKVTPKGITHPRVLDTIRTLKTIRDRRSKAGQAGAKKRWGKVRDQKQPKLPNT